MIQGNAHFLSGFSYNLYTADSTVFCERAYECTIYLPP